MNVKDFSDAHGGALVNLIHGYTHNGDLFIRTFTNQLLEEVGVHPRFVCPELSTHPGIPALLFDLAQMAFLWRTLRPVCRILCIP